MRACVFALTLAPVLLTIPPAAAAPCQPDEDKITICASGNSEYRVIRGTISPDKRYGIAWNTGTGKTGKDYELIKSGPYGRFAGDDPTETFLLRLSDGAMLKKLGGRHLGDAQRYNHTAQRAIWSPDSAWVVAINDGKWETATAETYRVAASGVSGPLDLRPLCLEAERRGLKAAGRKINIKRFAQSVAVESIGDNGNIAAVCWMQIVKEDDAFQFSVKMKLDASGKAITAKLGTIKQCPELEDECALPQIDP